MIELYEVQVTAASRARLSAAERELERVQGDIRPVIEAIKNGFAGPDLKAEWDALQQRKTALQAKRRAAAAPASRTGGALPTER